MKFYLASKFSKMAEMRSYGDTLKKMGHEITARWVYGGEAGQTREQNALMDVADVKRADEVVVFSDPYGTSHKGGGRHTELGLALAWGKPVHLIGYREQIFHHLPQVRFYETWSDFLDVFEKRVFESEENS